MAADAKYGVVQVRRGVMGDAYVHWSLPRIVGMANAAEILLTGRTFDGYEMQRLGVASRCPTELEARVVFGTAETKAALGHGGLLTVVAHPRRPPVGSGRLASPGPDPPAGAWKRGIEHQLQAVPDHQWEHRLCPGGDQGVDIQWLPVQRHVAIVDAVHQQDIVHHAAQPGGLAVNHFSVFRHHGGIG